MGKGPKLTFLQKYIQMADKHMKRFKTSLIIGTDLTKALDIQNHSEIPLHTSLDAYHKKHTTENNKHC